MDRKRFHFSKVSSGLERRKPSDTNDISRLATLAGKETKKPFLHHGELRIPMDADDKYRYWAGGQSIFDTLLELSAPDSVIEKYIGKIENPNDWRRWQEIRQIDMGVMKQIIKRLERLEKIEGRNSEQLDITIEFVGVDNEGKPFITGGLRMIPGRADKELPASFFDNEEIHNEA